MMTVLATGAMIASGGVRVSNPANETTGKEYVNPIIAADYSDPDVIATPDGDFYMTASSFQTVPGLPILHSRDLVNWEIVNYALDAVPPTDYYNDIPRHGKGVWAPSIRLHDGVYYIYWGDPDFGIFMVKATDPRGEWSEPLMVKSGKGMIDPCPLWDEDGKAYLINGWAGSRAGFNSLLTISEMSSDGEKIISRPRIVFDGNDGVNHTVEGPKLYKHDGWYYILAPAGGVVDGWQLALRSRTIYGPYEAKIVMSRGDTDINGPHQGGWVDDMAGNGWFLHFQDKGPYGRIIHLNPLEWKEGWPVIGMDKDGDGCGIPVKRYKRPASSPKAVGAAYQDITANDPDRNLFQWHANYNDSFGFPLPDGTFRIYSHRLDDDFVNLWSVPNLLLAKLPAENFTFTTCIKASAKGNSEGVDTGIVIMGWDYCRLGLTKDGDGFILTRTTCTDAEQGGKENTEEVAKIKPTRRYDAGLYPNLECNIWLRATVRKGVCTMSYSTDGKKFHDAGVKFQLRAGKWIGAKIGFYSIAPAGNECGWGDIIQYSFKED